MLKIEKNSKIITSISKEKIPNDKKRKKEYSTHS